VDARPCTPPDYQLIPRRGSLFFGVFRQRAASQKAGPLSRQAEQAPCRTHGYLVAPHIGKEPPL
jgi:hypothetical protein